MEICKVQIWLDDVGAKPAPFLPTFSLLTVLAPANNFPIFTAQKFHTKPKG